MSSKKSSTQALTSKFFLSFQKYNHCGIFCNYYKTFKPTLIPSINKSCYQIQSQVVYANGSKIYWAGYTKQIVTYFLEKSIYCLSNDKLYNILKSQKVKQIQVQDQTKDRIVKYLCKFNIVFKQNNLIIVYKNNVITRNLANTQFPSGQQIGKDQCIGTQNQIIKNPKVTNTVHKNTENGSKSLYQFQLKDKQQMQQFKNAIKFVFSYIQQAMQMAGVVQCTKFISITPKLNDKSSKQRKIKRIQEVKALLKIGENMKIFNSGFIVNAYGLCEREVQIRVDPETAKSNIKCQQVIKKNENVAIHKHMEQQNKNYHNDELNAYYKNISQNLTRQLRTTIENILNKQQQNQNKIFKLTNLYKIKSIEDGSCDLQIIGGVSVVQRVDKCNIVIQPQIGNKYGEGQSIKLNNLTLAKKIYKQNQELKNNQNSIARFQRQINLVRYICGQSQRNKYYLPTYFYHPDRKDCYYSTWHHLSLSCYLQNLQKQFSLDLILEICIQIVIIIMDLHKLGIVHRDLKPSNFIVDIAGTYPKVMLIDFSDSMIIKNQGSQVKSGEVTVYSTPVYCPIETSTFNKKYKQLGLIKTQIDNWSVGVLLYQILHQSVPISYSSSMMKDIHSLWQTQFLETFNMRKGKSMDTVKNIIGFLSYSLLKIKQQQRKQLQKILVILLYCKMYLRQICEIYKSYSVKDALYIQQLNSIQTKMDQDLFLSNTSIIENQSNSHYRDRM